MGKYSGLFILATLVVVVGIATIAISFSFFNSTSDHLLETNSQNIPYPGLSIQSVKDHKFQNYIEEMISKELRFRNLFIRINSQIFYSLFHKTFAEDSQIIVGKHHQLFEEWYITSYCKGQDQPEEIIRWADKIKQLNDYFVAHGKTFIYLITPSKAEYMPQAIPKRFDCKYTGIRNHVTQITRLLKERGVPYIDGTTLMVSATQKYGESMFPQGGTHWNWLGSSVFAAQTVDLINQQNHRIKLPPITFTYTMSKLNAHDSDDDLLGLVKLFDYSKNYLVPQVTFTDINKNSPTARLAIVGGSFNGNLIAVLLKNHLFSRIDLYFYHNIMKTHTLEHPDPVIAKNLSLEDIRKTMLAADVVILEENSLFTVSEHGEKFYNDFFPDKHGGSRAAR